MALQLKDSFASIASASLMAGALLATACGGSAPTAEDATGAAAGGKACCKGLNECKGKGGCKVEGKNECAGKNECKGQGGCNGHCPK